jgi:hypothetical protein
MRRRPGEIEARNWYLMELAIVREGERSDLTRSAQGNRSAAVWRRRRPDLNLQHKELRSHPVVAPGINVIRDAVGQMQKDVRLILGRLQPPRCLTAGLRVLSTTRVRGGLGLHEDPNHR